MDEERRKYDFSKDTVNTFNSFPLSSGFPCDHWHSTPVKKNNARALFEPSFFASAKPRDGDAMARQAADSPQIFSKHSSSLPIPQSSQMSACEMEHTTIQKQRKELQLLIAELKDRDQELNAMAAAHHKQLQAWEQDRQRVLTLAQRCARYEDELQKRNEVIRAVTKQAKIVEAREKDRYREVNSTQQQLHELGQKQRHSSRQCQDLEERNQSLNSTVMALSSQVGQLQVREEEISAMLKLKDKDVTEATNHILDLSSRLRELESSLQESRTREGKVLKEMEGHKRRFREARHENAQLKDELQQKSIESNTQREELIHLKQESQLLKKELALSGEGESWKDELLGLARSKQERTESELHCLRQVCENQQNDLQLLNLNLESAQEALRQRVGEGSRGRLGAAVGASARLEHVSSPGPERGEATYRQCHSRSMEAPPTLQDRQDEESQAINSNIVGATYDLRNKMIATPSLSATTQQTCTAKDGISHQIAPVTGNLNPGKIFNGQQSTCCHKEEQGEEIKLTPLLGNECDGLLTEQTPSVGCSCDVAEGPAEASPCEMAGSEASAEAEFVAVFNCGTETDSVLLLDISPRGPKDPQCSCQGDLTGFYLDCPAPSPRSRRSPDPVDGSAPNVVANGDLGAHSATTPNIEEHHPSAANRLQRLLAESRQMVASLERTTLRSASPSHSPTHPNCDSSCSLSSSRDYGNGPAHSLGSSQLRRDDDSQTKGSKPFQRGKECGP